MARPIAKGLQKLGLTVWYDESTLKVGDNLRQAIEKGLKESKFGVVVFSKHFFEKEWPRHELDGLFSLEGTSGNKKILPVWHEVSRSEVAEYSPILAGRLAASTKKGIDYVVAQLAEVAGKPGGSTEHLDLMNAFLTLAGRDPIIRPTLHQAQAFEQIMPKLALARDQDAGEHLVNRLFLSLGLKPIDSTFYRLIFKGVHFQSIEEVQRAVIHFRIFCMLEYGNFRHGYRTVRSSSDDREAKRFEERWKKHFPDRQDISDRQDYFAHRPPAVGIDNIPGDMLFTLGYVAYEWAEPVSEARRKLKPVLQKAVEQGVTSYTAFEALAKKDLHLRLLDPFIQSAALPEPSASVYEKHLNGRTYQQMIKDTIANCEEVTSDKIREVRKRGAQNTAMYLTMHDLDIYLATSMRNPNDFTTNDAFVNRLFASKPLRNFTLHAFNPTQSYIEDRIKKGLIECLMIRRAKLTIYNAQESDTFGKDSEAAVTLSQRKPVIVYVPRLFTGTSAIHGIYNQVDQMVGKRKTEIIEMLEERLTPSALVELRAPEKTHNDVLKAFLEEQMAPQLNRLPDDELRQELTGFGFLIPPSVMESKPDLVEFTLKKVLALERRAYTFRDIHPLSFQASPIDGVARGVFVTRTPEQTAEVLAGLLLGTITYRIVEDDHNWILVDNLSSSPVRVVTKDPVLTTAFWSTWTQSDNDS